MDWKFFLVEIIPGIWAILPIFVITYCFYQGLKIDTQNMIIGLIGIITFITYQVIMTIILKLNYESTFEETLISVALKFMRTMVVIFTIQECKEKRLYNNVGLILGTVVFVFVIAFILAVRYLSFQF